MPSPVIFSLTAMQALALIELYEGSGARIALRVQATLIEKGLAEQSGTALVLTPVGYHAAQLALALPTPWAADDCDAVQASLLDAEPLTA